jgi:Rad52/22 family double-strand break repair protein
MTPQTDAEMVELLSRPFEEHQIQSRPGQSGKKLSYVSHGLVTQRLTEADPGWSTESFAVHTDTDPQGNKHCVGVTLALTLHFPERGPVTRVETGGPARGGRFTDEVKVAHSDALKRCAMRFGVGLSMWEHLVDSLPDEDGPYRGPQPRTVVNGTAVGQGAVEREIEPVNPQVISADQKRAIARLSQEINDEAWCNQVIAGAGHTGSIEPGDLTRREASTVIKSMSKRAQADKKSRLP